MALRVVLDTMIFDELLADAPALELLLRAVKADSVRLVRTHIEQDQLADTPDEAKRNRLLALMESLPAGMVPALAFSFDTRGAGWDQAEWAGEAAIKRLADMPEHTRQNPKRAQGDREDALLALTAERYADVLVSGEMTRSGNLPTRLKAAGSTLRVWGWGEFRAFLVSSPLPGQTRLVG